MDLRDIGNRLLELEMTLVSKPQSDRCPICGSDRVQEIHCKIKCLNCNATRDCSDP